MPVIEVLLLATERESEQCTNQFIDFKDALGNTAKVNQTYTLKCHDVNSIERTQVRGSNKLTDKLENKIKNCKLILVVCSPDLKQYLEKGKKCSHDILGKKEGDVLKKYLSKTESKSKMILVYLNSEYAACIPESLNGVDTVDGIKDIGDLLEVKIPGKINLGS